MRSLSKSKLLSFRQCPKRMWLEIHRRELGADSAGALARFAAGHTVGELARQIYDPEGVGELLDPQAEGYEGALLRSRALMQAAQPRPIFEAGFSTERLLAFADVMLPVRNRTGRAWQMIEVKSATSVKDYHRDDVAIQAFAARQAGVPIASVTLAHIDNSWTYPGGGDYGGLLKQVDLTQEATEREPEVMVWLEAAHKVANKRTEPKRMTGSHCSDPFECSFNAYCRSQEPQAEYPIAWLPRIQTKALRECIANGAVKDLREVPDDLLNERQRRVKTHTLSNSVYFDAVGAAQDLAASKLPAYFLDFETVQFAVPIWKGTPGMDAQVCG